MSEYETPRRNMVESQIRPNRVTDPSLIDAFSELPRELFVPEAFRSVAYADEDIEIAPHRYLIEPLVLARLLQAAKVSDEDMALVIGCGTGYATAVLANLANAVVSVESDAALADRASRLLVDLGIDNAAVVEASLREGYPRQAPYDVILFNGAVQDIPESIVDQLAEGGRLVAVVLRKGDACGRGTLVIRRNGIVSRRCVFDASLPLLPGFKAEQGFVF